MQGKNANFIIRKSQEVICKHDFEKFHSFFSWTNPRTMTTFYFDMDKDTDFWEAKLHVQISFSFFHRSLKTSGPFIVGSRPV